MYKKMAILVAGITLAVFSTAAIASAGNDSSNGNPTGNGANGNGQGGPPTNPPPQDGCQPQNVPPRGEIPARDDIRCPGYNGNRENTFTVTPSAGPQGSSVTLAGGWCAGQSTVTFTLVPLSPPYDNISMGSAPVGNDRKFSTVKTVPLSAHDGPANIEAVCSTGTRTAAFTVT